MLTTARDVERHTLSAIDGGNTGRTARYPSMHHPNGRRLLCLTLNCFLYPCPSILIHATILVIQTIVTNRNPNKGMFKFSCDQYSPQLYYYDS